METYDQGLYIYLALPATFLRDHHHRADIILVTVGNSNIGSGPLMGGKGSEEAATKDKMMASVATLNVYCRVLLCCIFLFLCCHRSPTVAASHSQSSRLRLRAFRALYVLYASQMVRENDSRTPSMAWLVKEPENRAEDAMYK